MLTEKDIEGPYGCWYGALFAAVTLGFYALAAWGAQYAAAGCFDKQLPYWPTLVGLLVTGHMLRKATPSKWVKKGGDK